MPCETATVTETATTTATVEVTTTETATQTVTQTVVEQGEPTCGSGDLPPCAVQLDEGDDPWLLVTCGLVVCIGGALLVSQWGRSS